MGWCQNIHKLQQPDLTLYDINQQENCQQYELYLDYLKNDRKLNNGTIIEHITAAIYSLKFLFARYNNYIFLL